MTAAAVLGHARAVADAVLYEGYLLYPYRADSAKNRSRWQFGVLGPPGAEAAGTGENSRLASQFLIHARRPSAATITVHLRLLHLQRRAAEVVDAAAGFRPVTELRVGEQRWLSWDEAAEVEIALGPYRLDTAGPVQEEITIESSEQVEPILGSDSLLAGRLVRSRRALAGRLDLRVEALAVADLYRLGVDLENLSPIVAADRDTATAASFIGTHLIVMIDGAEALSLIDPPADAVVAAGLCRQHRCWPVLAGPTGSSGLVLVSPIILYDHPEIARQSSGALFDSTEIDEILTLRIMTMTDEEKASARATDVRAAEIIDRCDSMTSRDLQQLHGVLHDPAAPDGLGEASATDIADSFSTDGAPWWDPATDADVSPGTDVALIDGVQVAAGCVVRVHPNRRADAQDLFFAEQLARVTGVHRDLDGQTHIAVVLLDDPAADLHEWYGRFLYFAPDELEPVPGHTSADGLTGGRP